MNYIQKIRKLIGHEEIFVNCAAIWIENENGVLLERRGDDGNWGLIGGVMELGETPRDTALRELKEETQVEGEIGELIGTYTQYRHEYPSGDKAQIVVFFFHCSIPSDSKFVLSHESLAMQYFPREQLPELGMPQHREMAADALANRANQLR